MYNKILVPLDGSELAEAVLPHVRAIAAGCGVRSITLLRIVEPFYMTGGDEVTAFSMDMIDRVNKERQASAEKYLEEAAARLNMSGVEVERKAIVGRAAEEIAAYATKNGVDLIVIATHGRSGVSRWVWGSVADRTLRSACVPVLMVRPKGCIPGY
jgi:nucleotide-binding universal stress UspA family protein